MEIGKLAYKSNAVAVVRYSETIAIDAPHVALIKENIYSVSRFTLPAARVKRLDHSYQHYGPDIIPELPVTSSAARTLQGSGCPIRQC
ncbi:hypothetical protein MSG28_012355 [Choristoneura fumiferana]|uniref:Uncharacterized protein n=1 Tax=Choristoneura fumiferana TaxID=7141 RepID=A0ACC0KCK5_CHOFU|nr:hypothetical protein MSG28_012355 [Choristoneura fumiferana]